MTMIHLNAKRVKKASGTKRDKARYEQEMSARNERNRSTQDIANAPDVEIEDLTKDNRGVLPVLPALHGHLTLLSPTLTRPSNSSPSLRLCVEILSFVSFRSLCKICLTLP